MESQMTPNNQNNFEKKSKAENSRFLISKLLQSYSN